MDANLTEQSCYFINVFFISIFEYVPFLYLNLLEQPITLHFVSVVFTVLVFFSSFQFRAGHSVG